VEEKKGKGKQERKKRKNKKKRKKSMGRGNEKEDIRKVGENRHLQQGYQHHRERHQ
jgi:hypothetical protein